MLIMIVAQSVVVKPGNGPSTHEEESQRLVQIS